MKIQNQHMHLDQSEARACGVETDVVALAETGPDGTVDLFARWHALQGDMAALQKPLRRERWAAGLMACAGLAHDSSVERESAALSAQAELVAAVAAQLAVYEAMQTPGIAVDNEL